MSRLNETRLVVNADDLGIAPHIDAGIFEAHKNGIVTSASLFVNYECLAVSVADMKKHPELDVGLHLNLTWGESIADVPSLATNGVFCGGVKPFIKRALTGGLDRKEIFREIEAQMSRFRDFGCRSSHVDTHQHVYMIPAVAQAIAELAPRFGFHWVRVPIERFPGASPVWRTFNCWVSALMCRVDCRQSHKVTGVSYAGAMDIGRLKRLIGSLGPGIHELVCHPAADCSPENMPAQDRLAEKRAIERNALCSADARAFVNARNISLTNFMNIDRMKNAA
ncbi:MAG: ChbG/HpnK family deacetylase [Nitrospirae bacterium]|nr:ChbG/HpnK family deacetylase [Nitrospirota bacterium]